MNPYFQQIIIQRARKKTGSASNKSAQEAALRREVQKIKVDVKHLFQDLFLVVIGVFVAAFGLKGFLLPNDFIDGGVTGISLLVNAVTNFSFPVLIVLINVPFMILGYRVFGRKFAVRSILAIFLLALAIQVIPYPIITNDKLLVAVFGGFFLGLGIGLSIRGGAVIDGTEVLAVYLSRNSGLSIGDIILIFNVVIFSVGVYILSVEIALYAMLSYLAASKTVDFVIDGIEEYIGVTIISIHFEEIRKVIIEELGRGCTIYAGKHGYGKTGNANKPVDIIFTVLTRLELASLQTEIEKVDPEAFVVIHSIKDTKGGMIKKRPLKH